MISRMVFNCTVRILCDGSGCSRELTVDGETTTQALELARQRGWRSRHPHYWCPSCPVPPAGGQATIVKGRRAHVPSASAPRSRRQGLHMKPQGAA